MKAKSAVLDALCSMALLSMTHGALAQCDPCDANCDTRHDALDVAPFVTALLNGTSGCSTCSGDLDGNGVVDGLDIQSFVNCLLAPPATGACCTGASACTV